jgi:hypothetical protein
MHFRLAAISWLHEPQNLDERSAASGMTNVARTVAGAWGPLLTGMLLSAALWSAPFVLAGAQNLL